MGNQKKDRIVKPTPGNRVSVLFIISLAVVLAIVGVSAWSYFGKIARHAPPVVTASTEISATVEQSPPENEVREAPQPIKRDFTPEITETPPKPEPSLEDPSKNDNHTEPVKPASESESLPVTEASETATQTTEPQIPIPTIEDPKSGDMSAASERPLPDVEGKEAIKPEIAEAPSQENTAEEKDVAQDATRITSESSVAAEETSAVPSPPPLTTAQEDISERGSAANVDTTQDLPPETAKDVLSTKSEENVALPSSPALEAKPPITLPDSEKSTTEQADIAAVERKENTKEPVPVEGKKEIVVDTPENETLATAPPWKEFAASFNAKDTRPRIAIIISEVGTNTARTREAINDLPAAFTLGFNPYGRNLQDFVDQARSAGHEVLLQLPMEPIGYPKIDPGPQALRTDLSNEENNARLDWSLNRFKGYVGLTNQMGSKFTATSESILPVLKVIKEKGLLYLDSRTASNSVAAEIAEELNIPVAINNRFLDHHADGALIDARLAELEAIARQTGSAVGIAYPHSETFRRLSDWAETLDQKGLILAPVSAVVKEQENE